LSEGGELLFLKKKQQKNFWSGVRGRENRRDEFQKFFGSFFQKRTASIFEG